MRTLLFLLFAINLSAQPIATDSAMQAKLDSVVALQKLRREAALLKLDRIGETNFPFEITDVLVSDIDYAGGVNVSIVMGYYKKSKTIKYMTFTVAGYNAVGDKQTCEITGKTDASLSITGPIKASTITQGYHWGPTWYNHQIVCIKILKAKVEYTDGTTYTYVNELPKILNGPSNDCSYRE